LLPCFFIVNHLAFYVTNILVQIENIEPPLLSNCWYSFNDCTDY